MIKEIIKKLQSSEFYGAGEFTDIAKGKYELINNWKDCKIKIKRKWQSKK